MKLIVDKGELNLPEDFSFEIEQNSAFFSDDGAASVAATIPATPEDLAKLDNPTRIARNTRFVNLFPAILSHGVFQKKGNLVVTSASKDGITCAMALEDSEFYSQWKDKNLKELFKDSKLWANDRNSVADLYSSLNTIYKQPSLSNTVCLFPVAVNYNQESDSYLINNEPMNQYGEVEGVYSLVWEGRTVMEGDDKVGVPDGYGIAPFFYLKAFLNKMFQLCGYTIGTNCFATNSKLSSLILVHNCSDVICKGKNVYLYDLVPNKTISEILEWLRNKFYAQIVVYPTEKKVDIVLLNDILDAGYDMDLTGQLLGNIVHSYEQSSRIVLTPNTSLEGATPVTETEEDILKKYGAVNEFASGESQFPLDFSGQPVGLLLHLATGAYYEISRNFRNQTRSKRVGSNYFTYDRKNSQDAESISWDDIVPPMVIVNGMLMPYIGTRTHRNTSYNDSDKEEEQEIMVVDFAGLSERLESGGGGGRVFDWYTHSGHYYYGTTQKFDNKGHLREGKYNLNAPDMFQEFFARYNTMLRNNMVKVEGQFDIAIEKLLSYGMYSLKLYEGQRLLPISLKYEVGRKIRCLNAAFYLVKDYSDSEEDAPIVIPAPEYQWVQNTSEADAAMAALQPQYPDRNLAYHVIDGGSEEDTGDFFLPAPTALGQKSPKLERTIEIGYSYRTRPSESPTWRAITRQTVHFWYESAAI